MWEEPFEVFNRRVRAKAMVTAALRSTPCMRGELEYQMRTLVEVNQGRYLARGLYTAALGASPCVVWLVARVSR